MFAEQFSIIETEVIETVFTPKFGMGVRELSSENHSLVL